MLLTTAYLGNPAICNPETRAKSATHWAPAKAKSFTAVQHQAPSTRLGPAMYCPFNGSLMDRDVKEIYKVEYFSTLKEGESPLTGKPGSY